MRLAKRDAAGVLVHFDAEVEAQQPEVAHVEPLLHGRLELLHLPCIWAGDDEVVDVDPDQLDRAPAALPVHRRLVRALLEAHLLESCV